MRMLTTLLGVLASLVLLGVSGAMNYLFLSSLGKTPVEAQVLGAASAAADMLKALLPFFIAWGWRAGRYAVALPGFLVWMFFAGFSLLSAIGFAADNRGVFSHTRESLKASYESALADLNASEAKLSKLPKHRPVSIVTENIERHKQDRRWSSTKGCADATLPESRTFCEKYFALRAEMAAGIEERRIARALDNLKSEIEKLRNAGAGQDVDPQVSLLSRLFGHTENRIRLILIIIVAVLVEIGSSLGLFLATNHGVLFVRRVPEIVDGGRSERQHSAQPLPEAMDAAERMPTGDVVDFALDCLWPKAGGRLSLAELFEGYTAWCRDKNQSAVNDRAFERDFRYLAKQIGLSLADGQYEDISSIKSGISE